MSVAIVIERTGGPEELVLRPHEPGAPGPGQLLVRHRAIGVNFIDTYHRTGLYPLPRLPHGLGLEAAGVVEALGDGVEGFTVGQRVAYFGGPPGAYAEARVMAAERVVALPDAVTDELAAATLLKGMTAEFLVRRAFPVKAGDWVLLHAAAGGVGQLASQWLAHLGARVIATVGSDAKAELALRLGCEHAIVYTREDFVAKVRALTGGEGVAVAYDSVGKSTFLGSLDCLRRRGTLVAFGNASGKPDPLNPALLAQKGSLFLTRATVFDYTATRAELVESSGAVFDLLSQGLLQVTIHGRWPLAEAAAAHRALESRETSGSLLLVP